MRFSQLLEYKVFQMMVLGHSVKIFENPNREQFKNLVNLNKPLRFIWNEKSWWIWDGASAIHFYIINEIKEYESEEFGEGVADWFGTSFGLFKLSQPQRAITKIFDTNPNITRILQINFEFEVKVYDSGRE